MFTIRDKVVLITGGSKGIGLGIAKAFSKVGARVHVCGRNEPAPDTFPEGSGIQFVKCDVRDPESAQALITGIREIEGRIDVLINNAG
ncbi:MAG: SDR family NAD(P)-dependent oxidoreductase, partial [bacterium]